jgi:DNA-binding CsgD family transcriptional regulator
MNGAHGMLTVLGATSAEDRVYTALVSTVSATELELAEASGLSVDEVGTALASLIGRGLADRLADTPTRFVAGPPNMIELLISERFGELRAAQQQLDGLASRYRANSLARTAGGFEVMRGDDALRHCLLDLLRSARSEVLNLIKPPTIALQPEEQIGPDESVRNRIVYETAAIAHPGMLEALRAGLLPRDEARAHPDLPIKLLVVDRSVALVPLAQHDTTPVGMLVREGALLDALLALFEYVWATAIPLRLFRGSNGGPRPSSDLSERDRELLSLVLAGLSDEAIAMHRRMSVRTVQRQVHALMELAHVRTRAQLAWEAARRGWLTDADVEPEDNSPVPSPENGNGARL